MSNNEITEEKEVKTEEENVEEEKTITEDQLKEETAGESAEGSDNADEDIDFSQLFPDKMEEVLKLHIFQLQGWAYIHLGLQAHPKTRKVSRDMAQAKLSIDALSAMVEVLLPRLSPDEQRELKILASDLKMNFVSKMQEGQN